MNVEMMDLKEIHIVNDNLCFIERFMKKQYNGKLDILKSTKKSVTCRHEQPSRGRTVWNYMEKEKIYNTLFQ